MIRIGNVNIPLIFKGENAIDKVCQGETLKYTATIPRLDIITNGKFQPPFKFTNDNANSNGEEANYFYVASSVAGLHGGYVGNVQMQEYKTLYVDCSAVNGGDVGISLTATGMSSDFKQTVNARTLHAIDITAYNSTHSITLRTNGINGTNTAIAIYNMYLE